MKFQTFKSASDLVLAANLAIKNRLFVPNWGLIDDLNIIANWVNPKYKLTSNYKIVLCFSSGKPVAISLFDKQSKQLSTFVKPLYRNRGITKKLTELQNVRYCWVGEGNKYSARFAKSAGLNIEKIKRKNSCLTDFFCYL